MRTPLVGCALLTLVGTVAAAQDWNQWRGPTRSGVAGPFATPATWPERPTKAWTLDAGEGHASPVVSGGRVYLLSRIADRETVTALDLASGRQLWRQAYAAPYQVNSAATAHGKGPKSTPIVEGGRLFTLGISGTLSAWNASTGDPVWRKDFKGEFAATSPEYGTAMSPILTDGLLIVHAGGPGSGAIVALDPARGMVTWSWKGDGPAYSSSVATSIAGVRQIVALTQKRMVSLAIADGRLLWELPFTTEYDQTIMTPVIVGDLVVYGGVSKPTAAIRVARADGKWTTTRVWENPDIPMYMSSPVEKGGFLYGLTQRNRGQFFCADGKTGQTKWTTRGREGENAALIVSGDLALATTTEGELVVFRPNEKSFDLIKRYTIAGSPVWAHPVPAGKGILIKDASALTYWTF
jgi:outer membrane protein assembly factor BamB